MIGSARFRSKAARTFVNKIYKNILNIKKYPYQFSIEPLTVETQKQWRSMVAHPYFKVIFSIDEFEHKIYVVDIWDTRMDPEDLQSHINKL